MSVLGKVEAILFVASKPLEIKKIAKALGKQEADIQDVIDNLVLKYNREDSGIQIYEEDSTVQMGTNPNFSESIEGFVKNEIASELTRAQLETLTVIVYQGPITRPEIEEIRGVNCSIIIRNLLIRGLIDEKDDKEKIVPVYTLSMEALSQLGISNVSELPDYESLNKHEHIEKIFDNE